MSKIDKILAYRGLDQTSYFRAVLDLAQEKINSFPLKDIAEDFIDIQFGKLLTELSLPELIIDKDNVEIDTPGAELQDLYNSNQLPDTEQSTLYFLKYNFIGDADFFKHSTSTYLANDFYLFVNSEENWVGYFARLNELDAVDSRSTIARHERLAFNNVDNLNAAIRAFNNELSNQIHVMLRKRKKKAEFVTQLK